jgi:hypothetical protein
MQFYSKLAAMLMCGGISLFAQDARADGFSQFFKISKIETHPSGGFTVFVAGTLSANDANNNPASCWQGGPSGNMLKYAFFYTSQSTLEEREQIRQLIVSAFLSGRQISVYVSSASSSCQPEGGSGYRRVQVAN